ncbi:hypothetical protein H0H92_011430 [Tricholoma furcatifolium]|nr:hypothetical protein H0H92_011430 [Tricholoma furcatifolium]
MLLGSVESPDAQTQAEELPLYLPSSLPPVLRDQVSDLAAKEERLRFAHADDALAEIRRHRRILSGLYQFKKLNVSGTGNRPNTRMYSLFKRFNNRIDHFASRYHLAYTALSNLNPSGIWKSRFQILKPEDISGPGRDDTDISNGRFEPSWIWLVPRLPNAPLEPETEPQLEDSMRIDWAKAKARLSRWEEEVELVQEEMRRVVVYLGWQAARWRLLGRNAKFLDDTHHSGLVGYAERQADMYDQLAESSASCWLPVLQKVGIEPEWGKQFVISSEVGGSRSTNNVAGSVKDIGEWVDQEEEDEDDLDKLSDNIVDLDFFDTEL